MLRVKVALFGTQHEEARAGGVLAIMHWQLLDFTTGERLQKRSHRTRLRTKVEELRKE